MFNRAELALGRPDERILAYVACAG